MTALSLTLFVAGDNAYSRRAQANLERLVKEAGIGESPAIAVVDVLSDPEAARRHQILATPALLVDRSGRRVLVLGDLSEEEEVLGVLLG